MRVLATLSTVLATASAAAIMPTTDASPKFSILSDRSPSASPALGKIGVAFNQDLEFVPAARGMSLLRRVGFTPTSRDEYCGEFVAMDTSDAQKPLASDCSAIAAAAAAMQKGYYTITPGDYSANPWVTVARSGSCAYVVKLKAESQGESARIGTNDVRFQVATTVSNNPRSDGKAGFTGSVSCYNGVKGILADWKLAYAS